MDTLFIGKNIIFLPEIHSTNSYAIDLLKNVNPAEGTVVHTAHQTQGKGQRGSRWAADPGKNLTASVLLKPGFLDIKKQFFLYQITALACYDAMAQILNSSQNDIKIKWPNDILVNRRKIAGILLENNILNNRVNWCVAGIGINVNQDLFEEGLRATSLKQITGAEHEVKDLLGLVCCYLEKYYLYLKNGKYASVMSLYLERLYGLNEYLDFEIGGNRQHLLVEGIHDNGLLLLRTPSGELMETDVKQVKWLY